MNNNATSNDTAAMTVNKENGAKKVAETVWQVVKALLIVVLILAVIFDTIMAISLYQERNAPVVLTPAPYYCETQDWLDLLEATEKDPNSAKTDEMRKAFYIKYSVPYKTTYYYTELERLHREKPGSEEYCEALQNFQEVYDIAEEDISFDE